MDGENKEPQVNNLPPADFNAPKSSNPKLAIFAGGIFVVLIIIIIALFVDKNYFSKNSPVVENQSTQTQEITLKSGHSLYKDADTAISFQYPQTLSLLDRDEDGSKMLPNIFFKTTNIQKNTAEMLVLLTA